MHDEAIRLTTNMSMLTRLRTTWRHDIRLRTTVTLSLLLGSILSIAMLWRLGEIKNSLEESTQSRAHAIGRTFIVLGSAALAENLYRIQEALATYRDDPDISRVDLLDTDRMIIASTEPERIGRTVTDSQTDQALHLGSEVIGYDDPSHESRSLVAIEPLGDGRVIAGWVRIEFSLTEMRQQMAHATRESILVAVLLIGASVLLALFSMHRASILFRDTADRLQKALISLHQQFPDLASLAEPSAANPTCTISPDCGEIERAVALINHTIELLNRETESIRTFTSRLEEAVTSRTSQLNETIENLKRETAERAQTEQALRDNELKYRGLFESSQDAIMLLFPPDWKFTACNPSTVALFGADSVEHFTTLGPWDVSPLVQPDGELSADKAPKVIQQAMQEGSHFFEWVHRRINGSNFAATVLLTRISLNGQTGLQATVRDISEQKKAEQALRDLSAFQQAMLDYAGHAIISATPDGIIRVFNPAAEALLGYSAEDLINKQTPAIFHDPEEVVARAREFSTELGTTIEPGFDVFIEKCRRGLPNEHEWTYIRKDGRRLTVLLNVTALKRLDGEISAFLGVASDITPLKVIQQELTHAKEAAESSNKAKSQFLANMSHEIRTPMNGVLGMTELLLNTQMNERQQHMVETIHRSGTALLSVINDILDFSKIEAGKLELEPLEFDFRQTVEEAVELFAEPASKKGLELTYFIPPDIPPIVIGDPVRFRQVLLNLVGNAVKFTERGEVSVRVDCLAQEAKQVRLKCAITDTGIGIPKTIQQRLFTAFSQADGSTTRRFGGTGLGLAIVRQLVALMGGEVGIESTPGHGATFWFTVQFGCDGKQRSLDNTAIRSLAGAKILVVDDNATNRFILENQLRGWDADVLSADGATSALEALTHATANGTPIDLAILDIQMPDIDGIMLSRTIKKHPAFHTTTLIALSSVDQHSELEHAGHSNFAAWLRKPVRQSALRDCLLRQWGATTEPLVAAEYSNPAAPAVHCRILLAEDNPVNREVALAMLELLGCQVDIVENGQQAIDAATKQTYDLILMDCQMPKMDGLAATAAIRAHEASLETEQHVPIIALTANALTGDREKCLAAGMDDYLSKPFSQERLGTILKQWTIEKSSPSPSPSKSDKRAA